MNETFINGFIKAAMNSGLSEGQAIDLFKWGQAHSAAQAQQVEKKASTEDQLVALLKKQITR